MSNHTLGPWYVDHDTVWSEHNQEEVAVVIRVDEKNKEFEANARLIAAAPEMLEALETIVEWSNSTANDDDPDYGDIQALALEAIAEAKGETG